MLAGLITAPNHFDPFIRRSSAIGRRNVVLRLMRDQGYITNSAYREALREKIVLRRDRAELRYPYPYFVDYFKRWFLTNPAFGKTYDDRYRLLFTGGLRITTTLDPSVQAAAQDAVSSVLTYPTDPDAAVTVLDPRTGYVRAMVGGKDAAYWANDAAGRVNLATGAGGSGRQTGSAFKAFALVTALEHGISPDTTFVAPATIDIPLPGGGYWHVTNAEGNGYGTMSLRSATVTRSTRCTRS
jgi:Membrane carboxypeptidase (penicillin-binding protein)